MAATTTFAVKAHLDNPAALVSAVIKHIQDAPKPASRVAEFGAYLADDTVRKRMVAETQRGVEAVATVQTTFFRVLVPLTKLDAQNLKRVDGSVIPKFAPQWSGYFNTLLTNLNQTKQLAVISSGLIDTFLDKILPLLGSATATAAEKQKQLNDFQRLIDENETSISNIDSLVGSYETLSLQVISFQKTFKETMAAVGQGLEAEVKRLQADIDLVSERLRSHRAEGKRLGIATGRHGPTAAGFICAGILSPFALIFAALSLFFRVDAAAYHKKTQELEDELERAQDQLSAAIETKAAFQSQAVQPLITSASNEMGCVTGKLAAISSVLKMIKSDTVQATEHLSTSRDAHDVDLATDRDAEIKSAAASYANLKLIVDTFAVGLQLS
ncbi:hypothetical protein MKEN_00465900 [Mycena kentingensis (nom. inval.)]|nr:hypothetical protein MKEN_00465900 [Mycena kentingensis (nom. inval.)]